VLAAIAAGKHVLCEKPFTANAAQAESIAERAAISDVTVMEAFHYRYHPLADRVRAIVATEIGAVRHVDTAMCIPLPRFSDIRYQYDLAGGALMDAGCYAVHAARTFGPGEPRVTVATAKTLRRDRRVDRAIDIQTIYPDGATGRIRASMWSSDLLRIAVRVTGERGSVRVLNFIAPQFFHRITVTSHSRTTRERVPGAATYTYQLRAFLAATRGEPANLTPPADSVKTMRVIDDAYRAAGLPVRP
jgi:predicted dehydrogenase